MGNQYSYFCACCGVAGDVLGGFGESAYATIFCCNDCPEIFEIFESHDPEEEECFIGVDEGLKNNKLNSESSIEKLCQSCSSKNISKLTFEKNMKCPICKRRSFQFITIGDWD